MLNLNVFNGSPADFLDEVIASKRNSSNDPSYKQRVSILASEIKVLYDNYERVHDSNDHVSLIPKGYSGQEKSDLIKLYSSKNSRLVKLKNSITTVLDNRTLCTCQYCTIAPVSSLDHIVPKDEFAEFAVNPKNLLPSCSICNSYKSSNWKANNKAIFLNLYTDILPNEQYLFVDLIVSEDNIEATFKLRNIKEIDHEFYKLLESHYSRLHLLQRFKNESCTIISELSNLIMSSREFLKEKQIKQIIKNKIVQDKLLLGANYYKSILVEALLNNQEYFDVILKG